MRIRIYRVILSVFFILLALSLFYTQVFRGGHFYELGLKNTIRLIPEEPYRGRIFDRNNNCMADNVLSFDAVIIPQELKNKQVVFEKLAHLLSCPSGQVYKKYDRGYLNPFTPVSIATGIPKTTAIAIEEQGLDLPGVTIELNAKRFYPHASVASHVLGYLGEIDKSRITKLKEYGYEVKDKIGFSGLEGKLDIYLRGERGGQQIEVDNRGRQTRLLGYRPPQIGEDVRLTIDLEIQEIADQLLQGKKGAIIIMDVVTGEILSLSSAPAYDPNVFIDRQDQRSLNYYLDSEDAPLFNRAISGRFPPGSIFKTITALAALKTKKAREATTFDCKGRLRIGNRDFKCWATHGPQDFFHAVGHSCDVYFYQLGLIAGADGLTNMAHEFGLGATTGIDLLEESSGFIPSRLWKRLVHFEGWYDGDTANFSIGQGYVLVTPLQLARLMATVANGGYLVEPHLTKAIGGADVVVRPPKKIKVSKEDLDLLRESLRYPVHMEDGTAHNLDIAGLEICAKTGTAQIHNGASHGWVAGFFPLSAPRFAFCILLENVGTSHAACDLARQLFEEALRRKKI